MAINSYLQSPENQYAANQQQAMAQAWPPDPNLLSTIMENAGSFLILADLNLRIQYFSRQAAIMMRKLLGRKLEPGRLISEYYIAGFEQQNGVALQGALAGRTTKLNLTIKVLGELRNIKSSFRPVHSAGGAVCGVLICCSIGTVSKEAAQQNAKEKYVDLLLHNAGEGFLLLDTNLHIQLFNKSAEQCFQFFLQKKLVAGAHFLEYALDPQNLNQLEDMCRAALAGMPQEREYTIRLGEGQLIICVKYQPARNSQGNIEGCLIMCQNITQHRRKELAISDNEQRWRFALESSSQGVWDWDIKKDTVYYSEAWYQMFGYVPKSSTSSMADYEEKLHPADRELMRKHREKHFNSPVSNYESEFRLRDKDGHYRWVLSRGMIMERDDKGNPVRMIGTHTDITARKLAEEKYKVLFYKNPLPMWIYDQGTLRFLEVNEAALRQYGYDPEEFESKSILDIRPVEDRELVLKDVQNGGLAQNKPATTWRHIKKDGTLIWVNITAFTFQENGHHKTLVTAEDVTNNIVAEAKLKSSEVLYRHLFRSIPLPAFIYDPKTLNIIEANDRAITFYGFTARQLRTMSLLNLQETSGDDELLNQVLNSKSRSGNTRQWRHRTKAGALRHVELWASSIGLEGNQLRLVIVNDVTEKEVAEAEVRASSERFRHVMNATNDIVWDWQVGADQVLWSDHYQDIMGWTLPADNYLPFAQMIDCFHPDDKDRVYDSLQYALYKTTDTLWENAFRCQRGDGSYAYILDKGFILRRPDGTAYRMIGAMHDITSEQYQQEVQELELRIFALSSKPETKLQQVMENIAGGLEQLHENMRVCVAFFPDAHATTVIARRLPQNLYKWVQQFVQVHKNKWSKSTLRRGLTSHSLELTDRNLLMAEWENFAPGQVLSLPVNNNDGSLMASLLVFTQSNKSLSNAEWNALYRLQNLSRLLVVQHLAVEQIRQANERFDNVLKATHDLIWDWDLATGTFYRSPEALKRMYGVTRETEITNVHDWVSRIHAEDQERVQKLIEKILNGKANDGFDAEYRFLRDDGTYTYLYDRGIIIRNAQGIPVRMIGAAQDISERKHLEQELLQQELDRQRIISQATIDTQEQERADIGRELHDNVNQILTTTKLYLELAQSNHELKDDLVAKASKNIINVINEIRQLSRSLMDPSIGDLGLTASIRDLAENINLTRKINIKLSLEESLDGQFDESRKLMVFRIVQEAMSNIIRHARASEVTIKLKQHGKNVLLQVADNGVGFNPEGIKSGIGLKNIRNRVFLAHGTLQIIAAPGKGAILKILFPLHKILQ